MCTGNSLTNEMACQPRMPISANDYLFTGEVYIESPVKPGWFSLGNQGNLALHPVDFFEYLDSRITRRERQPSGYRGPALDGLPRRG
jgi:hypothetical protein